MTELEIISRQRDYAIELLKLALAPMEERCDEYQWLRLTEEFLKKINDTKILDKVTTENLC